MFSKSFRFSVRTKTDSRGELLVKGEEIKGEPILKHTGELFPPNVILSFSFQVELHGAKVLIRMREG